MSRGQQGQTFQTAQDENKSYNQNAQTSFNTTQGDVNEFGKATGKFIASNPYTAGGAYQTDQNQILADTASGEAQAAGQAIQGAAVRTGQNAGGAIAATENMEEQNMRTLSGEQADANAKRIAGDTSYTETGMNLRGEKVGMQNALSTEQAASAQGALGTQEQAANTPSFMDELGNGIIQAGVGFSSAAGKAIGACWIARELWGSWSDPRVVLVRKWLADEFSRRWYGPLVLRAYSRWGIEAARRIQTHEKSRQLAAWVFERALAEASRWQQERTKYFAQWGWTVTDGR